LLLAPSVARATANRADSATNPQPLMDLQSLIAATAAGDTLLLEAGRYAPATIDHPLTLRGVGPQAVIDGNQQGVPLRLMAPSISVESLRITGSGRNVSKKESGIWVDRRAADARLVDVRVDSSGFGIWVDKAPRPTITNCRIEGRNDAAGATRFPRDEMASTSRTPQVVSSKTIRCDGAASPSTTCMPTATGLWATRQTAHPSASP
jgi:nitrous oxidase accessory protein NosD